MYYFVLGDIFLPVNQSSKRSKTNKNQKNHAHDALEPITRQFTSQNRGMLCTVLQPIADSLHARIYRHVNVMYLSQSQDSLHAGIEETVVNKPITR